MSSAETQLRGATIQINGKVVPLRARYVAELVAELGRIGRPGVAVAVNGEVVPRSDWHRQELRTGDTVEVVGAVQGG
jgi:sulfur carrier protein